MAYNGAGIYGLYNVVENKIYIGASAHIENRFSQHRSYFSSKHGSNPMYQEPVENFKFLLLDKLSQEEFERFGGVLEHLFIIQAMRSKLGLYNQNKTSEDATGDFLWLMKTEEKLRGAVTESLGVKLWAIPMMSLKSRISLLSDCQVRN